MDEFQEYEGLGTLDPTDPFSNIQIKKQESYIKMSKADLESLLYKTVKFEELKTFENAVNYMLKDESVYSSDPKAVNLFKELKEDYNSQGQGNVFVLKAVDAFGKKKNVTLSENIEPYIVDIANGFKYLNIETEFISGQGGQ
ncbi:hypothetical protein J4468_01575 [Candidatus Woesearchaeota archaeon]|nr:hypothetical protein [Candidatus Woesearchaeota archaeon]